jgi:radical SAM superfamily enzyme YgiQ (UPF0313 family)
MKIYLGDLFHTWTKGGIWTIPLNVGYIASYTIEKFKELNIDCDVKIFKDPKKLIETIRKDPPDVVGLGFFVWNEKINKFVFDYVKENFPKILTIGGGPRFTNINANQEGAKEFFLDVNNCDAFVVNQGEKGFFNVVHEFLKKNYDIDKFKKTTIPGSLINNLKIAGKVNLKNCSDKIHIGENIGNLEDLNDIPSPYLSGLLDEFFDDRWMPVLETNRSCPYRCTFCAWGIGTQKLLKFSEERVIDEIQYISERCKKTKTLFIADANFGILERDALFAKKMYEMHKEFGFPYNVAVQWNKTRPDRIFKVAKEFKSIAPVGASMQSLSEDVLSSIKRKNLTFEQILELQKNLSEIGISEKSFTELIIGLPNETKETHLMANRKLIDMGFEINNYNLHLLPGTEMDEKNYRSKYFKKTGFRLHDNSYGIYLGKKVFEAQETVLETSTLSVEDFRYFRFFHFLLQMMWGKKWYYNFLIFLKSNHSINPVDFIDQLSDEIRLSDNDINKMYKNFMKDYDDAESFETQEELVEYWSKDQNFLRLKNGDYGKLNMLYTYKIILDLRKEFNEMLINFTKKIAIKYNILDPDFYEKCEEILKFQNLKFLKLNKENELQNEASGKFKYNILGWIKNNYVNLEKHNQIQTYKFYLTKEQYKTIKVQLKQNKSKNINSKLRDMSVYTSTNQFFYDVTIN